MMAHAILGPGARDRDLRLLRSTGLVINSSKEFNCEHDVDLVIVVGGDGTIHRFLPQLILSKKPILIVPCGSGNDLARAVGIRSVAHAANLARDFSGNTQVRQIDLGIISDSSGKETPFCCTAGIGLDAAAAKLANHMPRWLRGHGGYLIAALSGLLINPKMDLTIFAGTHCLTRKLQLSACLFTIANTRSFGGGLPIAPDARVDDGEFDCVFAEAMSRSRLARASLSLFRSTHLELPEVHFMRLARVRVESNSPAAVFADGEFVCETPFEISVMPKALCFCTSNA